MPTDFLTRYNEVFPQIQGAIQDYGQMQSAPPTNMGAVNPMTDINPYRVNPYRGYMAKHGGLMSGMPELYGYGGETQIEKLFLGKLVKSIGKGIGNAAKFVGDVGKGVGDFALSSLGMPNVINNSAVDNSGFLTGVSGMIGKVAPTALNMFVPGAGTALGAATGFINNATYGEKDMGRKDGGSFFNTMGTLGNIAGMAIGGSGGGLSQSMQGIGSRLAGNSSLLTSMGNIGSNQRLMQGLGMLGNSGIFSGNSANTGIGGGIYPPQTPNMAGIPDLTGFDMGNPYVSTFGQGLFQPSHFAYGGKVESSPNLVPVQTEKYKGLREMIVTPEMQIVDVNAEMPHNKMDDDDITDMVPDESYVASARPRMAIKAEDLEGSVIGYMAQEYQEGVLNTPPEAVNAATILPKGMKKILPAEYAALIRKTFATVEREDIFAQRTNDANLLGRVPYVQALVALGEANRVLAENPGVFKNGGGVNKYPDGGIPFQDILSVAGSALPLLGGLFGGNSGQRGQQNMLDPMNNAMMMASFPLSTLGIVNNVRSQQGALDNAMTNLTGLTEQQMGLNGAGAMAGIGATLMQDTHIPLVEQNFDRLANFNTNTPQSFLNAAATPTMDATSYLDRLGGRGGAAALSSLNAQGVGNRNNAAMAAFNNDRNLNYGIQNTITQGMNQQSVMNNQIMQQRLAAENAKYAGIGSATQGYFQNQSNILNSAYTAGTQLDLQRASLAGQIPSAIGQQMMNLASARQAFMYPGGMQQTQQQSPAMASYDMFRNAGGNTLGVTHNDVMSGLPTNTINVPPVTGINPGLNQGIGNLPTYLDPVAYNPFDRLGLQPNLGG